MIGRGLDFSFRGNAKYGIQGKQPITCAKMQKT